MHKKKLGKEGERIAAYVLNRKGYRVVEHNWTCRWGELDLIVFDSSGQIVFVEVKSAIKGSMCLPVDQFTRRKQAHLMHTINRFLILHPKYFDNWRLDLICVLKGGSSYQVTHYKGC